jgi:hypothetical protein
VNPPFGKVVKEVRPQDTFGFLSTKEKPTTDNAIMPAGVNVVRERPALPLQ